MITRDFSVISMTSQASLSLSLLLTKVTHAQYRKRFRASYNISWCACEMMLFKVNHFEGRCLVGGFLSTIWYVLYVCGESVPHCNNYSCNSNSRREIDEDREQRTNTTLKKDTVQTTSTNNSTPITPFYMQLRYSISPVTLPPLYR